MPGKKDGRQVGSGRVVRDEEMSDEELPTDSETEQQDEVPKSTDGVNGRKKHKALKSQRLKEGNRTLIVKNLPVNMTVRELLQLIELKKSDIETVRFRDIQFAEGFESRKRIGVLRSAYSTEETASKTAFVVLKSEVPVEGCLAHSGTEMKNGKHMLVGIVGEAKKFSIFDRKRSVFVGRLPATYDEEDLFRLFTQELGAKVVSNIRVIRDTKTLESKCFGYVSFYAKETVKAALNRFRSSRDPVLVEDHPLRVMRCLKESHVVKKPPKPKKMTQDEKLKVLATLGKCGKRKFLRYGSKNS